MQYQSENKVCQNCSGEFIIEPDDFSFYEKMKVPPPTFCPICRQQIRMLYRNFKTLYKRKSDKSGNGIVSMYSDEVPFPVYEISEWYGDDWDPMDYGFDIDFDKGIFSQIKNFFDTVPHMNMVNMKSDNCDYSNMALNSKNCYLNFGCVENENCDYGHIVWNSRDSIDNLYLFKSENCYECVDCLNSSKLLYSQECENCVDSIALFDCRNCLNCIGCVGLINKSYCIFNKQYSKEEYERLLPKLIEKMTEDKEFGNFFPREISPFSYNESIVNEYMPLSKEEALNLGFFWKDNTPFTIGQETMEFSNLPKNPKDYNENLINEIFACQSCNKNFKLINREIIFYKKHNLTIPNLCFNCRHQKRMNMRNQRTLFIGNCFKCNTEIKTSYSKEDQAKYKIYCEECYKKEIY